MALAVEGLCARAHALLGPWTSRTRCSGGSPSPGILPGEKNVRGVSRAAHTVPHALRDATLRDARGAGGRRCQVPTPDLRRLNPASRASTGRADRTGSGFLLLVRRDPDAREALSGRDSLHRYTSRTVRALHEVSLRVRLDMRAVECLGSDARGPRLPCGTAFLRSGDLRLQSSLSPVTTPRPSLNRGVAEPVRDTASADWQLNIVEGGVICPRFATGPGSRPFRTPSRWSG